MKEITGGVCAAAGFKAGGIHCGIRKNQTKFDLAMILSEKICQVAAMYTQNKVIGAPLVVTKQNISDGKAYGIFCNSGNANTCNPNGIEIAATSCYLAGKATNLKAEDFVVASTGVIGQPMSIEPFELGIPKLVGELSKEGSQNAATAIMTTDTYAKEVAYEFELEGKTCHIGCIGKGSGMIHPNMATMLAFITTDVDITEVMLKKALQAVVAKTLNQISIDGDTSTNDMTIILANGEAKNIKIETENKSYQIFYQALEQMLVKLCQMLASDGEGATKQLICRVSGAKDDQTARKIAKMVISSNLFKSAMFGMDANWGRALCAIGNVAGDFSASKITLSFKSVAGLIKVCEQSSYFPFSEAEVKLILEEKEIEIIVDMGEGQGVGTAWGCDLTYDYIKINGDYRT